MKQCFIKLFKLTGKFTHEEKQQNLRLPTSKKVTCPWPQRIVSPNDKKRRKRRREKNLKIAQKILCILVVAMFLCLLRVTPAYSINPFTPSLPVCASKTLPNQAPFNTIVTPLSAPNSLAGWCYIPAAYNPPAGALGCLRIEELYDDQNLAGDVAGGAGYGPVGISYPGSLWPITYPDGKVSISDIATIASAFAAPYNVPPRWNYMADVFQDMSINLKDLVYAVHFRYGYTGTYNWPYLASSLTWDPLYNITVQFFPSLTVNSPDNLGVVPIPYGSTSYVVTYWTGPVIGLPAPVVIGGPIGAVVTFWNTHP